MITPQKLGVPEQIADRLELSENTIETHVRNVLSKLQVSNRQEAIVFVLKHGLLHKFRGKITDFRDDN